MHKARVSLFIIFVIVSYVSLGIAAGERSFKAALSGGDVVPAVKTMAKGDAVFTMGKDGKDMKYMLSVKDIENVTAAHIHEGKQGKNGPPVAGLFAGPKKAGKFSGTLAEGTLTGKSLMGSLKGKPIASLVKMIEEGKAYVNVHTDKYPDSEIRGQIK